MSKFSTYLKRLIADSEKASLHLPVRLEQNALQFTRHLLTSEYFPIKQFKHSHVILIFPLMNEKIFFSYMISFFKARKRTTTVRPSAVC